MEPSDEAITVQLPVEQPRGVDEIVMGIQATFTREQFNTLAQKNPEAADRLYARRIKNE